MAARPLLERRHCRAESANRFPSGFLRCCFGGAALEYSLDRRRNGMEGAAKWRGGVYLLVCAAVYGPPLGALAAAAGITWRPCRSRSGGARLTRCCLVGDSTAGFGTDVKPYRLAQRGSSVLQPIGRTSSGALDRLKRHRRRAEMVRRRLFHLCLRRGDVEDTT